MRVLHISAAGKETGAGSAALNILCAQRRKGVDARILFLKDHCDEVGGVFSFVDSPFKRIIRFFFTTLDRFPTWVYHRRKPEIFSPGLFGPRISSHKEILDADIIHLHWSNHGFVSIKELKKINKPLVWTMHDMWVFTGGCHHSFSCNKYLKSCGSCPALNSENEKDLSYWVLKEKLREMPTNNITFVAISSWMREMADKSTLLNGKGGPIIFSGIDTLKFRYIDSKAARESLSLPRDKKIILLGAHDLLNPTKGVGFSLEALSKLDKDILVITFGNGTLSNESLSQKVINFGFIEDREKMAQLYSASDLFLASSVAEAFGMTVAEAQCCGTPAIAFDSTGPRDIIEHKISGYLARYQDAEDLVNGISYLLSQSFNRNEISERSANLFSIDNMADKYLEIYNERLSR
jgi:glycosyltransferase involved in cell wall biosynthesis